MQRIPDKSIDCIICDLPYGVLNKSNKHAQWDRQISFDSLWSQYKRIVKDKGAIVLFAQGMFTVQLIMSNPKWWRYNLIWDKVLKSGFLNVNRQPLRQHEDIVIFSSGQTTYNPQLVKCAPHQRNHRRHKKDGSSTYSVKNRCYGEFVDVEDRIVDFKYPTSIISIPKQHISGKAYHPTEKPVALIEYLIKTYTNKNDLVLDNCIGSGTTAVACIRTHRNYIGFELNEEYYNISLARIKDETIN